jgi:branched-chain amino acid transport system ATP-binding protein
MTAVLDVEDLTLHFGTIAAADRVTVALSAGEFVGIVGPNGAGKTTFLNLVTGYLRPESGRIRFMGRDIVGLSPHRITALGVGRSFQIPQLFLTLSVVENVLVALACAAGRDLDLWGPLKGRQPVEEAEAILRPLGLDADADRLASELPEGGRKLLDIGMALALRPRLLLMDEPTSGVSALEKFQIMDTLVGVLRERSVTAMFVEHDMEVVRRYASRALVLENGRIVADGPPANVLPAEPMRAAVTGSG